MQIPSFVLAESSTLLLIEVLAHTDALSSPESFVVRGWIIDELAGRGELHRVGMCDTCILPVKECEC